MIQDSVLKRCRETAAFIRDRIGDFRPEIAIVLGSGLGRFTQRIKVTATLSYGEIPHFKPTSVVGHSGNLVFGTIVGRSVVCQQGRYHYYEGHPIGDIVFPVRVMRVLGAHSLVITNAAGGINERFGVGDIMLIRDHINLQGVNALIGPNHEELGPRFPDMSHAYDPEYAERLLLVAGEKGIDVRQGIYLSVSGPSYETPAEIRMFRLLGADAVGMSTVNEVIAANHCGLRVLGLSCISNAAAGMTSEKLSHSHVEAEIGKVSDRFEALVAGWIRELANGG